MHLNHFKETLESTCLDTNTNIQNSSNVLHYNKTKIFTRLFRGDTPPPIGKVYSALNYTQVKELLTLNIVPRPNTSYVGGVVTASTKEHKPLNLVDFHEHILRQANYLAANKTLDNIVDKYIGLYLSISNNLNLISHQLEKFYYLQNQILIDIAQQVIHPAILYKLQFPKTFIKKIGPTLGLYTLMIYIERRQVFFEDIVKSQVDELPELIPHLSFKTAIDAYDSEELSEQQSPKLTEKILQKELKSNRKFNDRKAIQSKQRLAEKLYLDLKIKLRRATPEVKSNLRAYINSLRPPMKVLRQHYITKGDSPEVAAKLVNYQNYPYLPNVWLTKKHQEVLLDVIDGNEKKHLAYISRGFR